MPAIFPYPAKDGK